MGVDAVMWRGLVTRITAAGVYVAIPRLAREREFGPAGPIIGTTLAVGDRVLVGFIEDRTEDLVLLRKLP